MLNYVWNVNCKKLIDFLILQEYDSQVNVKLPIKIVLQYLFMFRWINFIKFELKALSLKDIISSSYKSQMFFPLNFWW